MSTPLPASLSFTLRCIAPVYRGPNNVERISDRVTNRKNPKRLSRKSLWFAFSDDRRYEYRFRADSRRSAESIILRSHPGALFYR